VLDRVRRMLRRVQLCLQCHGHVPHCERIWLCGEQHLLLQQLRWIGRGGLLPSRLLQLQRNVRELVCLVRNAFHQQLWGQPNLLRQPRLWRHLLLIARVKKRQK
jgi:hypothetical protein